MNCRDGRTVPEDPGVYVLWLVADAPACIGVGKLGTIRVHPRRAYVYVGSAMGGLASRIGHHLTRTGKKMHWHIDYMLEHLHVRVVYAAPEVTRKECEVSQSISALKYHFTPIKGFGNSDCKTCESHLYEGKAGDSAGLIKKLLHDVFRSSGLQPVVVPIAKN